MFLLGGSALQVDLLRAAKARYHVIVVDGNDSCALRGEADQFVHLDFSNFDELRHLALAKKPSLILTMASEPGNLTAAKVSEDLGLTYNSLDVVLNTINKIKMKKKLSESGITTADFRVVDSDTDLAAVVSDIYYPVIVKPSQSSGGRGVRLVKSDADLVFAVENARKISKDGCALVEDYIEGLQYSIETISCKSEHAILGITREYFGAPPYFAEIQHMFPANLDEDLERKVRKCVLDVLDCMGIRYGACHIEIRVSSQRNIYVIEVASRIGGWRSELIWRAKGVDYADLLICSHEQESIKIEPTFSNYSVVKMIFSEADLNRQNELHKRAEYEVSPVTWLKSKIEGGQTSLMDSAGYYFIKAENLEDAENAL